MCVPLYQTVCVPLYQIVCMCVPLYQSVCVCVYLCIRVCVYLCIRVCVCVRAYLCIGESLLASLAATHHLVIHFHVATSTLLRVTAVRTCCRGPYTHEHTHTFSLHHELRQWNL